MVKKYEYDRKCRFSKNKKKTAKLTNSNKHNSHITTNGRIEPNLYRSLHNTYISNILFDLSNVA